MLNSVTSFVGLLPLLLNRSVQAQFLIPMAIALSFGVLFSTLLTQGAAWGAGAQFPLHLTDSSSG